MATLKIDLRIAGTAGNDFARVLQQEVEALAAQAVDAGLEVRGAGIDVVLDDEPDAAVVVVEDETPVAELPAGE
jgi:hypothetical protein